MAALHHELAVDPLRWFADFAREKRWHSSDAVCQQLQGLIQMVHRWNVRPIEFWVSVAAMEELARQI